MLRVIIDRRSFNQDRLHGVFMLFHRDLPKFIERSKRGGQEFLGTIPVTVSG